MKISLILFLVFIPSISFAVGIVPTCNTIVGANGNFTDPCGFNQLVILANNIIRFLIIIGASLASIAFAYAGWLYITSGGDTGKISQAKDIFRKIVIGFVMMLAAWLIISLIIGMLGYTAPTGLDFIRDLVR